MKTSKNQKFFKQVFTAVPRMQKAFSFKLNDEILEHDLTIPHIAILREITHFRSPSMGQLVSELNISCAMMTHFVDQLVEKDLVRRKRSQEDRRVVQVVLTKTGKNMIEQVKNMHKQHFEQFLKKFSTEDRDSFIEAFNKLYTLVIKYSEGTNE